LLLDSFVLHNHISNEEILTNKRKTKQNKKKQETTPRKLADARRLLTDFRMKYIEIKNWNHLPVIFLFMFEPVHRYQIIIFFSGQK